MTFDNVPEVEKCALVSKKIQLIMRIITDDRGSQCRLSSKFGAPKNKWRPLLQACRDNGLECVGVSFHVGSGCRDASRYEAAIRDARAVFDLAESEFGFKMTIVDIGGGFPGETHSMWNPAEHIDPEAEEKVVDPDDDEVAKEEGKDAASQTSSDSDGDHFLFFSEIAELISPLIDELFPEEHVRVIGEPGRYLVAASHTLVASVIGQRNNAVDDSFVPEAYDDKEAAAFMNHMTRDEEKSIVRNRGMSFSGDMDQSSKMMEAIVEEFNDYSKLFAKQHLAQQESDVYNDGLDFYAENFATASDMLGPPEAGVHTLVHTAEGVNVALATDAEDAGDAMMALAAAGEAAVKGVVLQAVADVAPLQDDYAYYINDGTYGAFNNIMFDHATVRPRHLKNILDDQELYSKEDGRGSSGDLNGGKSLYASTVFGPTCDSIDVIARSVLLPKLQVGDWLYFQNMGAYTSAAASAFNGFQPSPKFYTCSVKTKFFEQLIAGPKDVEPAGTASEEKKEE
jgi:diaminopimelate decarboxylase